MQWIYIICFALISAGLLALFGVRPGDFIDALFRSQRKAATLSDELNVLMGTPAKGFFNQDYELKQILKGTGRSDRYEAVKRLSLILFAVGAVLALLINNVYMVPILGIGFSLAPIWYLRSTAASYGRMFGWYGWGSLLLPALATLLPALVFALGSGWLLGQIRPWLVYVWMAVPFLCMALPLPDALGIWNGHFFSKYPLALGTLDPAFSMPAAVLIVQCILLAAGIVLLMVRPARSKR